MSDDHEAALPIPEIESIEVNLVLEALFQRHGYDLRGYNLASVTRRLRQAKRRFKRHRIVDLIGPLPHEEDFVRQLIDELSVNVTEFFRDPSFFQEFRKRVVPVLHTYPFVKIWHAGCATGEEVYSMAILLEEEGLAERATIYATDFNASIVEQAERGIFALDCVKEASQNYHEGGGKRSLLDYFHAYAGKFRVAPQLRSRVTFATHNLVTDQAFGCMNVIVCRNVLIYFGGELQTRVLELFVDSLLPRGFLCLGPKESLRNIRRNEFENVNKLERIFRWTQGSNARSS